MLEREAEEARAMGWLEEAGRLMEEARKYLKLVRELEDEIAELESKCFIGEE
jgi:type II secretory pathway predicted ATPase ExeA